LDIQSRIRAGFRSFLKGLGKTDHKLIAVFGLNPVACQAAVSYVRTQAPEFPVWLFTTVDLLPETERSCERVFVESNPVALLVFAEVRLWRQWVALSVGTWTGERGRWTLKLAPFLIPPFRALFMNKNGDFLSGASAIRVHMRRQLWDAAQGRWQAAADAMISCWHRSQDLGRAYWLLVSYHIWRSGPCRRVQHVIGGISMLALANALKWCGYPHRHWFERVHGSRPLTVLLDRGGGAGVIRFVQTTPNWLGEELDAAAQASHARWLIWQNNDALVPSDELLRIFEDDRTFAISIQYEYRGWKPSLLPTAPFRGLQSGEASQVLAPVSSTIVVDRRKLLALGVPRCNLAITAWLLLFWKAAAAGWRSYTIGQNQKLQQQPDYPLHEAAFFLHVLATREVRELGAAEPDLARGSIAFYPRRCTAEKLLSDRLRVLIVSPFVPYPLCHGGAVRIYNLCRALRDRVDFILAAVREQDDTVHYGELRRVFLEVAVVDIDELPSTDERLPQQVRQYQSRSLRALIHDLSAQYSPDLIQIEYTQMALFRGAAPNLPAVLVEHDLTFNLYWQLAEREPTKVRQREYERWQTFESRQLQEFDAVWTVSDEDRWRAVHEGSDPGRTYTVPNGVDIDHFIPASESTSRLELLYVGSFRHLPNILGFETLCRDIMPRLWRRFPDVRCMSSRVLIIMTSGESCEPRLILPGSMTGL